MTRNKTISACFVDPDDSNYHADNGFDVWDQVVAMSRGRGTDDKDATTKQVWSVL